MFRSGAGLVAAPCPRNKVTFVFCFFNRWSIDTYRCMQHIYRILYDSNPTYCCICSISGTHGVGYRLNGASLPYWKRPASRTQRYPSRCRRLLAQMEKLLFPPRAKMTLWIQWQSESTIRVANRFTKQPALPVCFSRWSLKIEAKYVTPPCISLWDFNLSRCIVCTLMKRGDKCDRPFKHEYMDLWIYLQFTPLIVAVFCLRIDSYSLFLH